MKNSEVVNIAVIPLLKAVDPGDIPGMVNLMLAELRSRMNAAQERLRAALCSEDPADYQAALVEFESSNEAYMNALTETFIAPRAEKVAGPDKSPDV